MHIWFIPWCESGRDYVVQIVREHSAHFIQFNIINSMSTLNYAHFIYKVGRPRFSLSEILTSDIPLCLSKQIRPWLWYTKTYDIESIADTPLWLMFCCLAYQSLSCHSPVSWSCSHISVSNCHIHTHTHTRISTVRVDHITEKICANQNLNHMRLCSVRYLTSVPRWLHTVKIGPKISNIY